MAIGWDEGDQYPDPPEEKTSPPSLGFDIVGYARSILNDDPRFSGLSQERKDAIIDVAVQHGRVDFKQYLNEVDEFLGTLKPPADEPPADEPPADEPPADEPDETIVEPETDLDELDEVEEFVEGFEADPIIDTDPNEIPGTGEGEGVGEQFEIPGTGEGEEVGEQFTQADIDAATAAGAASVTQNFTQADIDAATATGEAIGYETAYAEQADADPAFSKEEFAALMSEIGVTTEQANQTWDLFSDRFTDPTYDLPQALIEIYDTQLFEERFPGIHNLRAEDPEGVRGIPSPQYYLAEERAVKDLLAAKGLEDGIVFDELMTKLIVNRVSSGEVEQRLNTAEEMMYSVPIEVKDKFIEWYGPNRADPNLMLAFIDPEDEWGGSWVDTKSDIAAAKLGGWSQILLSLDTGISQASAESIAQMGYSQGQAWDRFHQLKEEEGLFTEKIGEEDLTLLEHGVEAKFGADVSDKSAREIDIMLKQRKGQRLAAFRGGGGAMVTQTGTGLGVAR
tara:strand:+ start:991 stop:2514 length:1524 start_codon:yes stop_codon:yes gene_type:complete